MSQYYKVNGMKVRVSDHEANTRLNGSNDITIWTKDACGNALSIGGQIDRLCDKHNLELSAFESIVRDYADTDEECKYILIEIERS